MLSSFLDLLQEKIEELVNTAQAIVEAQNTLNADVEAKNAIVEQLTKVTLDKLTRRATYRLIFILT